jgi:hypothetical protein
VSTDSSLPPDFEFFQRVRPLTAEHVQSLAPYCARYEQWKTRHNITCYTGQAITAEAARELQAIYHDLHQWGLQQCPPFIMEDMTMTEQRRQEVVAELCRNAGLARQVPEPVTAGSMPQADDRTEATEPQTETENQTIPFTSPLGASDLARLLRERGLQGATADAVDAYLRRYRADHPDCYIEVDDDDRRMNTPRYLHRPEVWDYLVQHFRRR